MSVIPILIIVGIVVASGFLIAFIWAVRNGQYDDSYSPAQRILFDDLDSSSNEKAVEADSDSPTSNKLSEHNKDN